MDNHTESLDNFERIKKRANNCGYENGLSHSGCWCEKIEVPKELREMIPENLKGKACICKECVINYKEKNNMD